jgi:hypothetical protein
MSAAQQLSDASIRRLLSAVHEALDVAIPARGRRRLACLILLEHRARIAQASIGRLICTGSDELDYDSEADHIRHQLDSRPQHGVPGPKDSLAPRRQALASGPARSRDAR